jgi:molybdopterin-guanine dinucleotide biosynthesis protein A
MSDFAAALLAGGRSRRMGTDKAFLQWQGRPLWEHQLEKLRALEPAQLLLSCREEQVFGESSAGVALRPARVSPGHESNTSGLEATLALRLVYDEWNDAGPLGGVAACLRACEAPHLVVLGVDLPHLPAEFLKELLTQSSAQCGAVVRVANYFEPLAAVYPRAMLPLAEAQLAAGQLAMQDFIRRGMECGLMQGADIPVRAEWFTNWNSPQDLPSA